MCIQKASPGIPKKPFSLSSPFIVDKSELPHAKAVKLPDS
jgi:hypothetical protein